MSEHDEVQRIVAESIKDKPKTKEVLVLSAIYRIDEVEEGRSRKATAEKACLKAQEELEKAGWHLRELHGVVEPDEEPDNLESEARELNEWVKQREEKKHGNKRS